jgi:iron(III) transport system ATP-binding protein
MASLKIVDLVKQYGDSLAVDHLNLEVIDGEFLTLLGPSGCGKTTVLRAIAGLVEIDAGEIYFDQRLINDVPPHRRSTALVFQSYALFPHMTIGENIAFGLQMRKVPREVQAARVNEVMAMVGLEGLRDRRPGTLSGGQQQRVALARAVVTQPDILLFDEPLSNLDAKLRERLRIEIRELQQRLKITSIYVTHDQMEAMVISDRIVVMNKGRIEQIGDPASIYQRPASSFTADFIGQATILEGRLLSATDQEAVLETPVGRLISSNRPPRAGEAVTLSWRPEDLQPFAPGLRNCLQGRVVRSIYMGNFTHVFVEVGGTVLTAQMSASGQWRPGEAITLGLAPDKIQLLR